MHKDWHLKYYSGEINTEGLNNLILPHNATVKEEPLIQGYPSNPVGGFGEKFWDVIDRFMDHEIPKGRFKGFVEKVEGSINKLCNQNTETFNLDFLFISYDRDIAHPGGSHYGDHGPDKIYIGNGIHRFIAYGLYLKNHDFKPLKVFYVECKLNK